ncbi:Binding-protein-dependent transport system inner membrane component [uncultured archaeon]|nr:Binding-protein-dependent transport system inner membrane component [uncultured archaeon]
MAGLQELGFFNSARSSGQQATKREAGTVNPGTGDAASMNRHERGHFGPGSFSFPGFLGLMLFLSFLLMASFSFAIAPCDPWVRFQPFLPPGWGHFLGTNDLGNDILSELIYGSKVSLIVGFGAALLSTFLGTLIGLLSGYYKGLVDEILMGITDIFLMIPQIPLIIVLAAFLKPSFWMVALLLGCLWWTSTARVIRSKTLQIREMSFIEGSRSMGFSDLHIIFSDVLPNIFYVILPKFLLAVASAMIAEASISFLGLGDASMKSWGMMINFAFTRGGFINGYWWWYLPPGLCISLSVLSVILMGFALEERDLETERIE